MDTPKAYHRTKSSFFDLSNKAPSLHHANSGKNLTNKATKSDSMSKFMSGESTMVSLQDSKVFSVKSLKKFIQINPITVYPNKTGPFQGFAGYSYKNNKRVNEDKLDININFVKGNKTVVSLYSIYDGHGGELVADYLKDNLHKEIINNNQLMIDSKMTILDSYEKIEMNLMNSIMNSKPNVNSTKNGNNQHIISGSCAILLMTIDNKISVVNLGDSRGIISINNAQNIFSLSIDHKPNNENEKRRILACGGSIQRISNTDRVFPGGLSVSRSFGDFEYKIPKLEGELNVISAIPDIVTFDLKDDMDFILLGSDGIYENLNNKIIVSIVYSSMLNCINKQLTYQNLLETIVYKINKQAIRKGTMDNISCIFLPFIKFKTVFDSKDISAIDEIISSIKGSQINGERLFENITDSFIYTLNIDPISSLSSSLNLNKKSTMMYQNIFLFDQSFSKSNISFESKRNESKLPQNSDDYETSDEVHKQKANSTTKNSPSKKSKPQFSCCGLFA